MDINYHTLSDITDDERDEIIKTHFFPKFGLQSEERDAILKTVAYFIFTTLTTVGFGDYYPVGNIERLFGIPLMFFGVMIFSYVMGVYGEILERFKDVDSEFEETDKLYLFFGVIKHFNENEGLKPKIREEIEDYFKYRWAKHRYLPMESEEGREFNR